MQFVKHFLIGILATSLLAGCASIDLAAMSDKVGQMLGMSKRTYSTRPEAPPATPSTGSTPAASSSTASASNAPPSPAAPVVIAPPVSANANANAPDFVSYRVAAARRIMQVNSSNTYAGEVPEPLLAVPVLEISLNRDGSVKSIDVLRKPHFAPETIEMAKAAIMRAAPFGSVAHLPQPWQFNETFLYNDNFKFQLHSLQP